MRLGLESRPKSLLQHEGIPQGVLENMLIIPFNDAEAAEHITKKHKEELAAVVVEPAQRDIPAEPNFLKALREVTCDLGIPLVFDEVITFRLSPGGAKRLYGVELDITMLGKIIGGGLPIGAYAFTEELSGPLTIPETPFPEIGKPRLDFSGTFNADPLSMAAGIATLRELRPMVYHRLNEFGERMREGIGKVLEEVGVNARILGVASLFKILWTREEGRDYRSAATSDPVISHCPSIALINRWVYMRAYQNVSAVTTEEDIHLVLEAFKESVEFLMPIIKGRAPPLLEKG